MPKILLFCVILIGTLISRAQTSASDYFTTNGFIPEVLTDSEHPPFKIIGDTLLNKSILIRVYILRDDNGVNQFSFQEGALRRGLNASTERLSQEHGMNFFFPGEVIYVDSTNLLYNDNMFIDWINEEVDPRYLNIYCRFAPFIISACGSAFLPGSGNMITLNCMDEKTIMHEIGHAFGLLHTFAGTNSLTDELVDGSNCEDSGDLVCDTPADPYPIGDFDGCSYTDNVLTDVNGDLFAPQMDNIMSYYNCEPSYFTPGQVERMKQLAVQDRFYYTTVDSASIQLIPHVEGMPGIVCEGSNERFKLDGFPGGGSFSGVGVQGDSLDVSGLNAGEYEVTYYLPPTGPVTPYLRMGFIYGNYHNSQTTDSLWQSFTAEETAPLEAIRLRVNTDTVQLISWKLLDGVGPSGSVLHAQTDTLMATDHMRWYRLPLTQAFTQQAGQSYTLVFETADSLEWQTTSHNNSYFDWPGSIPENSPAQFPQFPCLGSEILSQQPHYEGDSITIRYQVVEPRPPYFTPDTVFCLLDEPVDLSSYSLLNFSTWGEVEFLINQQAVDSVSPGEIGPGLHELEMNYIDYNECAGYLHYSLEVVDTPQVTVPLSFCEGDPTYDLTQLWPEGSFFFNSVSTDSINPAHIGIGSHTLEMQLPNIIDTLPTSGYTHPLESGAVPSYTMRMGDLVWQTFTAERSGYLGSMTANLIVGDSGQFRTTLWKGTPLNGQLMHTKTNWFTSGSWEKTMLEVTPVSTWIEQDSLYYMAIERVDSLNESPGAGHWCSIVYDNTDIPPGLESNLDTLTFAGLPSALFFSMNLDSLVDCSAPQIRTIEVHPRPEVPADLLKGPDTVWVGSSYHYAWGSSWGDSLIVEVVNGTCLNCGSASDSLEILWETVGTGSILVYGFNGTECISDSVSIWVQINATTGLDAMASQLGVEVFPNPFFDQLSIRWTNVKSTTLDLALYDAFGRLVWAQADLQLSGGDEIRLPLPAQLAEGIYSLKVVSEESAQTLLLRKE